MPLPGFDPSGDFPVGVHKATLEEVVFRFGRGSRKRELVTENMQKIETVAKYSGRGIIKRLFPAPFTGLSASAV